MASKANKILTFPSSLLLDIVDIDLGEEWGGAGGEGEEVRRRGMFAMSLPIGRGGSDARRAAAAERGRGKNGRIMDGRGPGVDGWRKRRWRREDGGCDASDSSSW